MPLRHVAMLAFWLAALTCFIAAAFIPRRSNFCGLGMAFWILSVMVHILWP